MTLRVPGRIAALAAVPAVLVASTALAAPAFAELDRYGGSAVGLDAQMTVDQEMVLDETVPEEVSYEPGGEKTTADLPESTSDLATLTVLVARSQLDEDSEQLRSKSRTADFSLLGDIVTAEAINADCSADGPAVEGDSDVAGLTIAGINVPVDQSPNFSVDIPESLSDFLTGSVVLNETEEISDQAQRIRALHADLLVDPAGLELAASGERAVPADVRSMARGVKTAIEQATGRSLAELASPGRAVVAAPQTPTLEEQLSSTLDGPAASGAAAPGSDPSQRPGDKPDDNLALLGVDVIVSEVMCKGRTAAAVNDEDSDEGDGADNTDGANDTDRDNAADGDDRDDRDNTGGGGGGDTAGGDQATAKTSSDSASERLPDTGGNSAAIAGTAAAGLALVLAGSASVLVARRRGRHAR